jgi:hypothetical protein
MAITQVHGPRRADGRARQADARLRRERGGVKSPYEEESSRFSRHLTTTRAQQALPTGSWAADRIPSTVGFAVPYMAGVFQGIRRLRRPSRQRVAKRHREGRERRGEGLERGGASPESRVLRCECYLELTFEAPP